MKENPNAPTFVVGYEFTNKQGLKAVVIAYNGRKNIDIQFEDGAIVTKTTGSYIKKGLPLHPTYGKVQIGDKFPCKDGDTVEVVEYISCTKVKARWQSDGAEKWTSVETLTLGVNKHPNNWKFNVGDKIETNNHGTVEVVEFNSASDILVKFQDGSTKQTTSEFLRRGTVRPDGFFKGREGYEFKTNSGWYGKVVEWKNAFEVLVKWQDGSMSWQAWAEVSSGSIKPLYQPSVSGVGFIGDGLYIPKSYKASNYKDKLYADDRIYAYWQRMITRCYNEKEQQKPSSRAYIDCSVEENWHNFQNFAEWAYKKEQATFKEGDKIWELDKDLLIEGNRVYGEYRCTFLPPEINIFLSDRAWSEQCPRGVNYIKPATAGSKEGWIARCHIDGERKYLGYYDDPMTAFFKYKEVKESYAKTLADRYEDLLERDAFLKLREFSVAPYS